MKEFKGRVVIPGQCSAKALVSHVGFNTLASYQTSFLTGDKKATCSDPVSYTHLTLPTIYSV